MSADGWIIPLARLPLHKTGGKNRNPVITRCLKGQLGRARAPPARLRRLLSSANVLHSWPQPVPGCQTRFPGPPGDPWAPGAGAIVRARRKSCERGRGGHAGKSTHILRTAVPGSAGLRLQARSQGSGVRSASTQVLHSGAPLRVGTTPGTPCSWGILLRSRKGERGIRAGGGQKAAWPQGPGNRSSRFSARTPGSRRWRPEAARCPNRRSSVDRPG